MNIDTYKANVNYLIVVIVHLHPTAIEVEKKQINALVVEIEKGEKVNKIREAHAFISHLLQ
jgi:hypothetical protein